MRLLPTVLTCAHTSVIHAYIYIIQYVYIIYSIYIPLDLALPVHLPELIDLFQHLCLWPGGIAQGGCDSPWTRQTSYMAQITG